LEFISRLRFFIRYIFSKLFSEKYVKLGSILASEWLTRYILDKKNYRFDGTVRHNAFMPPIRINEVSIYRIIGLNDIGIWRIGNNFVAQIIGKPLLARADILASHVLENNLSVSPAIKIHPRHANIIDWPKDRSEQKMVAIELAAKAQLHLLKSV
jgi:hypothetical protein